MLFFVNFIIRKYMENTIGRIVVYIAKVAVK